MSDIWTNSIKDKMKDYEESSSTDLWAGIDKALDAKAARKRRVLPILVWSGSVAACLAMVFLITRSQGSISGVEPLLGNAGNTEDITMVERQESNTGVPAQVSDDLHVVKPSDRIAMVTAETDGLPDTSQQSYTTDASDQAQEAATGDSSEYATKHSWVEKDGEDWSEYDELDGGRTAHKGKWSAALGVKGAGSQSSSHTRGNIFAMGSNPLENTQIESTNWAESDLDGMVSYNSPETEVRFKHKQPVRLGITARYNFNKTLGIESGLGYTILNSDITESTGDNTGNVSSQTLHYIGIPLNLTCNVYSNKYINIYVSGGGMGEKCVSGRVRTNTLTSDGTSSGSNRNICPKGISWSANAAAGLQVNILKNLGIYVEPGVSHHFDKSQGYRSIYTDKPTTFSLAFGLRVNLNK